MQVIWALLTYAVKTKTKTGKTKHILGTNEIRNLRKILGKTRENMVVSNDIREQYDIQKVMSIYKDRPGSWKRIVKTARDKLSMETCNWELGEDGRMVCKNGHS